MLELFATLTSIALVDSLSVIPVAMVPLALLLGGRRPLAGSLAFIGGILATYLLFGTRSERWFGAIEGFIRHWGPRVLANLLIALGALLIVDGIGWLYGWPLLVPSARG